MLLQSQKKIILPPIGLIFPCGEIEKSKEFIRQSIDFSISTNGFLIFSTHIPLCRYTRSSRLRYFLLCSQRNSYSGDNLDIHRKVPLSLIWAKLAPLISLVVICLSQNELNPEKAASFETAFQFIILNRSTNVSRLPSKHFQYLRIVHYRMLPEHLDSLLYHHYYMVNVMKIYLDFSTQQGFHHLLSTADIIVHLNRFT